VPGCGSEAPKTFFIIVLATHHGRLMTCSLLLDRKEASNHVLEAVLFEFDVLPGKREGIWLKLAFISGYKCRGYKRLIIDDYRSADQNCAADDFKSPSSIISEKEICLGDILLNRGRISKIF
jgi:hypothetical protein